MSYQEFSGELDKPTEFTEFTGQLDSEVTDTGDETARLAARYKAPQQPGIIQRAGAALKPEFKSVMEDFQPTPEQKQADVDRRLSYGAGPISSQTQATADAVRSSRGQMVSKDPTVSKVVKAMDQRGDKSFADLVDAANSPANIQAARETKAQEFRSAGEWAADTLSNLSQGAVGLVQLPINIISPSSSIAASLSATQKELQAQESDVLKAQREKLRERVQNEDGFFDKYAATVVSLVTSPALSLSEAVKQVPNFLGIVGASRLIGATAAGAVGAAGKASPALALGEAISGGAIQAGARVAGTTAGGAGASMVMAGGDAAGGVYEKLTDPKQTPLSVWKQNPDYQKMVAEGKPSKDAIEEIATTKARIAALVTAPLGLLGFAGAESAIASRGLGKATAEALTFAGAGKMLAKDLIGEQLEEGGTQFGGNVISSTVNPNQKLTEGVPEAMATALVTSAPFSAAGAASQFQEARAAQAPDIAAERQAVGLFDVNSYDPTLVDPRLTSRQQGDTGPAAPINFTPAGSPTQQAGLVDIVVPTTPETTDVSATSLTPLATPGSSQQPSDQLGGGLEVPGLDVANAAGQRGGIAGQPGANVPQAGAVPIAAGQPAAGLSRPFERATNQDLMARTEAAIASQENNNADKPRLVEPWLGRRGDGYVTQGDAAQAIGGRQKKFPNLDWKVEQMPNGKFMLSGYSTTQETTLGTQASQAQQAAQEGQQAPAITGAEGPGMGQSLATGGAAQTQVGGNAGIGAVATGPVAESRPAGALATPEGAAAAGLKASLRLAPPAPLGAVGRAIKALKADTGIDAEIDNAPMTERQQAASAIARLSGRTVTFLKAVSPGVLPNGFMLPGDSKNIYIANDSDDAPLSIAMHEIYHSLPEPQRKALNTQLLQLFRTELRGEFAGQFGYKKNNDTLLDEEIPAFMVQAISKRADFWQELRTKMGNQEFAEVAKVILSKLNSIIGGAKKDYGDDFVNKYITDVAKARDLLTTAYAEAMQEQGLTPDVKVTGEVMASSRSRVDMNFKDVIKRTPELQAAAEKVKAGEMTAAEYDKLVNEAKPVEAYKSVPQPATVTAIEASLKADQIERIGKASELKAGYPVGLRLDIPAYSNHGTWVVSVHEQEAGYNAGKSIGYEPVAAATNVRFGVVEKAALNIAGGKPKATIAVMKGSWKPTTAKQAYTAAQAALKSKDWTQVGMDPERHSYFYDRKTMEPVVSADELLQIGPLVLAKNAVFGDKADFMFSRRAVEGNTENNSFENNNADVMPPEQIRADGIMFSLRKVEEVDDAPEITMQDLVDEIVFPILADLTAAGYTYMGKELRGGPYYTLLPSNSKAGLIWANDSKGVSSIKNKKAARGVIGLIVAMKQDSHATNNTVANIIFRAVEDEIQKGSVASADIPKLDDIVRGLSERKTKNKKTGEMEAIFPRFADFPGFSDRVASEKFLRDMPFEARGLFFEEMTKPTVEDLGLGVIRKVINDTVEPDLRGLNMGDVVMAIRFDPDADTIELGKATGTPEHDSYRYGVKGTVIGKFKRPISFENVFVDLMAERRAAGKDRPAGNYRSLTLRKPEQKITQEIADLVSSESYKTFKSPAEAKSAVTSAGGGWSVIDRPTGAGVKEFLRTARIYGEGSVPSFAEAKVLIKDEDLKIFRLGETENWFSVESRGNKRVMTHIMVAQPGVRRETLFGDMVYQAKANGATHIEIDGVEAAIQEQERERPVAPIIEELSAMKDADLVNLGISPKEINRLNGLIEEEGAEQFSPTSLLMYSKRVQSPADRIKWRKVSDVKTEIGLDSLPRHIIPFATFMRTMADKAANGGLTSRDLIKAYTIARSSMNRSAVTTSKIKDAGLVLPKNFVDEKIRPEGAFGYWLLSPVGQRYLNAAEVAIVDQDAVADAVKVMAPFGTQNALGKDLERAAAGELHSRLPNMTAAIAKAATGKNAVKDWQDATDNLFGVREAKKGFLGSLLGFGQLPTFDARQINVNVKADSKEDTLRALSSVKARDVVAKLARRMDALSLTMDPEYAPFYQHLAHHAVWDAVGGTETTHSDVVESMLMASNRAKPAFYSQLERVIANVPAKLATQPASQWALWLDSNAPKAGVKKDEVEWSGIKDYLTLRGKEKVTSAELQDYLKSGGVKVEESMMGGEVDEDALTEEVTGELFTVDYSDLSRSERREVDAVVEKRMDDRTTQYDKYTLPGSENYRELLLKLPSFDKEERLAREEANLADGIARNDLTIQRIARSEADKLRAEKAKFVQTYQSSHWGDKNVLAHIRINDRMIEGDGPYKVTVREGAGRSGSSTKKFDTLQDAQQFIDLKKMGGYRTELENLGKLKVLFVEEVQSDWGQEGLKKGFRGSKSFTVRQDTSGKEALAGRWEVVDQDGNIEEGFRNEADARKWADLEQRGQGVPKAPFVTKTEGWLNLALKRIAMLAVTEGYDKVAFVNGQQSADRYDLSKSISSISYEPGSKPENEGLLQAWDLDRNMVMSEMVTTDRIEDYVGKDVAVRLLETDKVMGKHLLDGENIKVGGKGMIKFYDEIVPQALSKLLPKIGGEKLNKVGIDVGLNSSMSYEIKEKDDGRFALRARADTNSLWAPYGVYDTKALAEARMAELKAESEVSEQPGFDVTDKMRETVGAGLPMFSKRANKRQKLVGTNFTMDASSKTDAARIKLQDDALRMKRVIEAVKAKGGTVGEAQNFYDANTLMPGRIQAAVDNFKNDVIRPMLDKAAEFGIDMDELSVYAYAKHAKERNAYIASINPRMPDGGSGMTNNEADNILQMVDLAGDTANFEELHQALMGIASATRQVMLSEGLITQDEFTTLEGAYENYIPLRGFEDVDAETGVARPGIGRGVNIRGAETVKAMGRKSKAGDLIENVIRDYERVISRVEKNDVAKVLLDFVLSNPDPDLWGVDVERSKPGLNKATGLVQYTKAIEKGEDTIGVKVGGQQVYIKFADKELTRALRQAWKDETSGLERATLAMTGWWNDWMRAVLTKYNPAFALINIPRDALWSGTASALAELGPKGLAAYLKTYGKALMASTRQEAGVSGTSNRLFGNPQMDARFAEFRSAGGITGGFYMRSLDDINQDLRNELLLAGAAARNPWEAIKSLPPFKLAKLTLRTLEFMGAASENATRFALYQASREVGNSPAKAAILAKDGTTNFNRKGEWGGALNNLYLFFNAAVQGNAQLFKVLKSPAVQASMAGVTGIGMMLALYGASAGGEDDDGEAYWDKIPSFVKERNIVIMLPPGDALAGGIERVGKRGRYVTIPVQYGFNMFPNAGYVMADVLRNAQDPKRGMTPAKAALHMTSTVLGSINPFGGAVDVSDGVQVLLAAMPTLVDLPIQIITERGTFGTPSSPQKSPFDKRPDSERMFTSQQDSVSAKIAKALNELGGGNEAKAGEIMGVETSVAPGTIQTLISATTGGLGSFVEQVGTAVIAMTGDDKDLKANKIPFLNKFYGEVDEGANIGKASERMREVKKLSDEVKAQQKLGLDPALKDEEQRLMALSGMQEIYQKQSTMIRKREIEIIKDPKMTDAEKKLERKQLQVERDKLSTDMNREYLRVVPK